ncbi:hypothetical protein D3C87_1533340 [compost metagenome]
MANGKRGGLLALGLAAAAYWIWGMKKEDKDKVKETVRNAGSRLKDKLPQDIKDKLPGFASKS